MARKKYLPLRIGEELELQQNKLLSEMPKDPANDLLHSLAFSKPQGYEKDPTDILNLDDFLSWVLGSTFCKRNYDGKYKSINDKLLLIYERQERQGKTYKECRTNFRNSMSFHSVFRCWEQYKQVYRFDADFVSELMQTTTLHIPTNVLKRLPVRCFYLDTEHLVHFPSLSGLFVYIGFDEVTGLPNLGIYSIEEDEEVQIRPGYASGQQMLKSGILQKKDDEIYIEFTSDISTIKDIWAVELLDSILFTLQAMLYLSSNKPDTAKGTSRKYVRTVPKNTSPHTNMEVTEVGIRYGAAIRKAKKTTPVNDTEMETVYVTTEKTRRPITSHIRAAHWHHYWVGKGRTEQVIRWIPPTFVSAAGKELPVTIHKVKN